MNGRPEVTYVVMRKPTDADYAQAKVPKRLVGIFESFEPGRRLTCRKVCSEHRPRLPENDSTAASVVSRGLAAVAKTGALDRVEDGHIPDEFLGLRTVSFWLGQLRGSARTNVGGSGNTTRSSYARHLWRFNRWLTRGTHAVHVAGHRGGCRRRCSGGRVLAGGSPARVSQAAFESVEDLIELLARPLAVRSDVAVIVKRYLMDPEHRGKRASTMASTRNAILSYFKRNEQRIEVAFDPAATYDTTETVQTLTLGDVREMLTVAGPSVTEKAAMLCKLHRGLDVSTLIDRFNFEAWGQMARHFGSEDHHEWDLDGCPVPVTLTRLKTGYTHLGFLERDAVAAVQQYLDWRRLRTGRGMSEDLPLFLSSALKPIGSGWVTNAFSRLAWGSGVQQKTGKNSWRVDSHEMRSLLKSTLIECGCRMDVADHVIGHKPKDVYEKQSILYGETVRAEYAKAAHMLNIFSGRRRAAAPGGDHGAAGNGAAAAGSGGNDRVDMRAVRDRLQEMLHARDSPDPDALIGEVARIVCMSDRHAREIRDAIGALCGGAGDGADGRGP